VIVELVPPVTCDFASTVMSVNGTLVNVQVTVSPASTLKLAVRVAVLPELATALPLSSQLMVVKSHPVFALSVTECRPGVTVTPVDCSPSFNVAVIAPVKLNESVEL